MAEVKIKIEGLKALQRKLRGHELYAAPYHDAMDAIGQLAVATAKGRAPVGPTGRLRDRLRYKIQKRDVPRYVVLKTTAVQRSPKFPRGYPYPALLEFGTRSKHKGWMRGVIGQIGGQIESLLQRAADEIAKRWED